MLLMIVSFFVNKNATNSEQARAGVVPRSRGPQCERGLGGAPLSFYRRNNMATAPSAALRHLQAARERLAAILHSPMPRVIFLIRALLPAAAASRRVAPHLHPSHPMTSWISPMIHGPVNGRDVTEPLMCM